MIAEYLQGHSQINQHLETHAQINVVFKAAFIKPPPSWLSSSDHHRLLCGFSQQPHAAFLRGLPCRRTLFPGRNTPALSKCFEVPASPCSNPIFGLPPMELNEKTYLQSLGKVLADHAWHKGHRLAFLF